MSSKTWLKIALQDLSSSNTKFDDAIINLSTLMPDHSCDKEDIKTSTFFSTKSNSQLDSTI